MNERILVIGDPQREVQTALMSAVPGASVTSVGSLFEGIAELSGNAYSTVIASVEPIERRPEAAVKVLRQLTGEGRLVLFGHPTLEPVSRKMLAFGVDDYMVTPTAVAELQMLLGTPVMRSEAIKAHPSDDLREPDTVEAPTRVSILMGLPLTEIFLDALLQHPADAPGAVIRQLNTAIAPTMQLLSRPRSSEPPEAAQGLMRLSHPIRVNMTEGDTLHLLIPQDEQETEARHFLSQLSLMIGRLTALQDRHNRLQKLAITDDLTGLYNGRYFRHFLNRMIERARTLRFPVTLLLFDIDDFKKYNDQFGHGVGDDILKQTATLIRRCCRDHDLVARVAGDEFAVVFWEKDGPRQAHQPGGVPGRPPQTPVQILQRFRRLVSLEEFPGLGSSGKGTLTISGGLAVFPYDAQSTADLIAAADKQMMFGAKKSGKNSIFLVGVEDHLPPEENPA